MKFKGMKQAGFSLVELMVVVGIIGILAAIAVPKLQRFTAKAKQSEAKSTLRSMDSMQQAYYAENSTYGTDTQIGFAAPGGAKYGYVISGQSDSAYTGTATWSSGRLCPNDANTDTWTINQTGALSNSSNGADGC
jgi:type IV pilus assembly protein PilA